jgi:hypothetical protein
MLEDKPQAKPPARAPLPDEWWRLQLRTRRLIAAGVAIVLLAGIGGLIALVFSSEPSADPVQAEADAGPDAETYVAEMPPSQVATFDQLAECESGGQWDTATGNGFEGGLQFTQSSWQEVGGEGSPAAASREEQIMRADMLYQVQGYAAWPSCAAQLGLDG